MMPGSLRGKEVCCRFRGWEWNWGTTQNDQNRDAALAFQQKQGQGEGGVRDGPPGKVEFWDLEKREARAWKRWTGGLVVEALMSDEELLYWEALEGLWAVEDVTSSCSLGIPICSWCVGWVGYFQTPGRPVPVNGRKEYLRQWRSRAMELVMEPPSAAQVKNSAFRRSVILLGPELVWEGGGAWRTGAAWLVEPQMPEDHPSRRLITTQ